MVQLDATARSAEAPVIATQSARLWGLDWSKHLPWCFDGITVDVCTFEESLPFMQRHFGGIFGAALEGRFLADPMTTAKRRFGSEMDVFIYRDGLREVGVMASHPTDWSTYFMRTVAFLPEYRDRRLLSRTVEQSYDVLRAAGCERIDGDVAPTNIAMMRMLTRLGWLVTSSSNTERWGTMLRFTKFLRSDAEDVFARQFCGVRTVTPSSAVCDSQVNQGRRTP